MELTLNTEPRKGGYIVYNVPGLRGCLTINKSMIKGEPPAYLNVDGVSFETPGAQKPSVAKMSPEERKAANVAAAAARKAETPVQKAARAQETADKAAKRAEKLAAAARAA